MTPTLVTMGSLLMLALATPGPAAVNPREPELGRVRWGRDLDRALSASKTSGRPVLILFDEVPGCATCVGFGQQVLSDPLLSEAIETEFVPMFVANCRGGRDAELLARFGEPAWNNPVVRFLDATGRDVIPRRDGLYSPHAIASRMIEALEHAGRSVPDYLRLARDESHLATQREATFAMACFWEGEGRLGAIDGVVATRAVTRDGHEAVEVRYDESRLPFETLVRAADRCGCADRVWVSDETHRKLAHPVVGERVALASGEARPAGGTDQWHALARSPWRALELTASQSTRVNAALVDGTDPLRWLSPRQRERALALGGTTRTAAAATCRAPGR